TPSERMNTSDRLLAYQQEGYRKVPVAPSNHFLASRPQNNPTLAVRPCPNLKGAIMFRASGSASQGASSGVQMLAAMSRTGPHPFGRGPARWSARGRVCPGPGLNE